MKKGDSVIYIDKTNNVLTNGEKYKVFSVTNGGIQIHIKTGFAVLTNDRFIESK